MTARPLPPDAAQLSPLLADVARLKRLRGAGGESFAAFRFRAAWAALASREPVQRVAATELALAAAHVALGAVDAAALAEAGLGPAERRGIYRAAAERALGSIEASLGDALAAAADPGEAPVAPPAFAERLATAASAPMRALPPVKVGEFDDFDPPPPADPEPVETLGEHSWAVAVGAALLARVRREDIGEPVLLALAHHAERCELATLPEPLAAACRAALADRSPGSPAGAAFAAAHVADRVLEQRRHANDAGLSLLDAGAAADLVGRGPLGEFELAVLRQLGLAF